jgi:hypothetical protein
VAIDATAIAVWQPKDGELQPHPQHVAALRRADGAHRVGIRQLTLVLRIRERVAHLGFKITHRLEIPGLVSARAGKLWLPVPCFKPRAAAW